MTFWKQIGQQIQDKRNRRGISQRELGERIGTSKQFISNIENGYPCSVKMLDKIAGALSCKLIIKLEE